MPLVPTKFRSIVVCGRVPGGNQEGFIERCRVLNVHASSTPTKATTSFLPFSVNYLSTSAWLQYAKLSRNEGKEPVVVAYAAGLRGAAAARAACRGVSVAAGGGGRLLRRQRQQRLLGGALARR